MSVDNKKFKKWELRHLKKRCLDFGLNSQKQKLESYIQGQDIDLEKVLYRLSDIPGFSKTCRKPECQVCSKVENLKPSNYSKKPWEMSLELYRWQKKCKDRWIENGGNGIVRVVTGAGKTIFALSLISYLKNKAIYQDNGLKVVIVVPNTALLDQWFNEVKSILNLGEDDFGVFFGEQKDDIEENDLMIYVLNSARRHLEDHLEKVDEDVFLIADECHRFASEKSAEIFENTFDYTVGLSATPERDADYGFENVLVPNLGDVIYTYSYSDARDDNIIPPFHLKRVEVPLQEKEEEIYEEYTEKLDKMFKIIISRYPVLKNCDSKNFLKTLGRLQREHDDDTLENYTVLANKRKEIIHESISKMSALKYLINNDISKSSRVLIFHERTESADRIHEFLQEQGFNSGVYHTKINSTKRREALKQYRENDLNILVTCKALDEGLDVPDTDVGIIVAATSSVRQRIQRIGRILRRSPGKDYAQIFTIYIRDKEERIFERPQMKDLKKTAEKVDVKRLSF